MSLGQAFRMEKIKDGAHRALGRNNRYDATLNLAYEVEALIDQSYSKTAAIRQVAEAHNCTVASLTKALKRPTDEELAMGRQRLAARHRD